MRWSIPPYKSRVKQAASQLETKTDYSGKCQTNYSAIPTKEKKDAMEPREIKGLEIAAKLKIIRKGDTWYVRFVNRKDIPYFLRPSHQSSTTKRPQQTY